MGFTFDGNKKGWKILRKKFETLSQDQKNQLTNLGVDITLFAQQPPRIPTLPSQILQPTPNAQKSKCEQIKESDPEKARFFNFTYTTNDGAEHGAVTISLIDETSLKIYYGSNISSEMDREQRKEIGRAHV